MTVELINTGEKYNYYTYSQFGERYYFYSKCPHCEILAYLKALHKYHEIRAYLKRW
jgi:hypothetical protein